MGGLVHKVGFFCYLRIATASKMSWLPTLVTQGFVLVLVLLDLFLLLLALVMQILVLKSRILVLHLM